MAKSAPYVRSVHVTDHVVMDTTNCRYPRVIAADATPSRAWIKQGSLAYSLASVTLNPEDCPPCSVLRVTCVMQYHSPAVSGKAWYLFIGDQVVSQVPGIAATAQTLGIEVYLYVRSTGVSVMRAQANAGAGSTTTSDGTGNFYGVNTSAAPTSVNIDMSAAQTLSIKTRVSGADSSAGEWHELLGFSVESLYTTDYPPGYLPTSAIACWGDSLTIGSGAVLYTSDYPSVIGRDTPGRVVYNGGVGGEKSGQILTRMLLDKVRGKRWTTVLWMGRNNVNDVGMQDTVMADIASAVANLSHSRFLVLTVLNSKTETTGTANYNAIIALNNAILAAYPNNSYDMRSHLATDPDGTIPSGMMSDVIHLNATGYAEVAAQVSAFLSGKGW